MPVTLIDSGTPESSVPVKGDRPLSWGGRKRIEKERTEQNIIEKESIKKTIGYSLSHKLC